MERMVNRRTVTQVVATFAAVVAGVLVALVPATVPAQGITTTYFYQPANGAENLWQFKSDGSGTRTTYADYGSFDFGTPFPFAWTMNETAQGVFMNLQYGSGHTDSFLVLGYDPGTDILYQDGSEWGDAEFYGCNSGYMPPMYYSVVC